MSDLIPSIVRIDRSGFLPSSGCQVIVKWVTWGVAADHDTWERILLGCLWWVVSGDKITFTQDNQAGGKSDDTEGRKDNSTENLRQRILEEKQFLNLLSTLLKMHYLFCCRNRERQRKDRCDDAATDMKSVVTTEDMDTKDSVYTELHVIHR